MFLDLTSSAITYLPETYPRELVLGIPGFHAEDVGHTYIFRILSGELSARIIDYVMGVNFVKVQASATVHFEISLAGGPLQLKLIYGGLPVGWRLMIQSHTIAFKLLLDLEDYPRPNTEPQTLWQALLED